MPRTKECLCMDTSMPLTVTCMRCICGSVCSHSFHNLPALRRRVSRKMPKHPHMHHTLKLGCVHVHQISTWSCSLADTFNLPVRKSLNSALGLPSLDGAFLLLIVGLSMTTDTFLRYSQCTFPRLRLFARVPNLLACSLTGGEPTDIPLAAAAIPGKGSLLRP